jgi:hypothetical protein
MYRDCMVGVRTFARARAAHANGAQDPPLRIPQYLGRLEGYIAQQLHVVQPLRRPGQRA